MATSIDNNEADEKSGKSMCQLINIRCTSTPDRNDSLYYENVKKEFLHVT